MRISFFSRGLTRTRVTASTPPGGVDLMLTLSKDGKDVWESKRKKTRFRRKGLKTEMSAGDWRKLGRLWLTAPKERRFGQYEHQEDIRRNHTVVKILIRCLTLRVIIKLDPQRTNMAF